MESNKAIAIVTDAWHPQVNGVVTTLSRTKEGLETLGYRVLVVSPPLFRTLPCPTYPEIRLALARPRRVSQLLDSVAPAAIHIATEGPLGLAARRYCRAGRCFTTSFHTRFPEYVKLRFGIPTGLTYRFLRWFHRPAHRVLVATPSLKEELERQGFERLCLWSRGVDTELFRPYPKDYLDAPRPISMYVGRVAVEKNLEAFLGLPLPGTKYVVGDGPALGQLRARYPEVRFAGFRTGYDLARHIASADVFVFPSRTDTFGLVLIEALACGVPVAAYPVPGPQDIVVQGLTGCLSEDLAQAVRGALMIPAEACRGRALQFSWSASTQEFLQSLCTSPA
jgi:1,2-diacylglycerol 3-alpha-glucosyltransferase/glucuronosyltransferase